MRTSRALIGIIGVAILLRVAAAFYMGNQVVELPGTADQLSYHTLALRIINGHGFSFDRAWWPATAAGTPTAHWSFLYTFYLAAVYTLFGPHPLVARLIQVFLVGALQPILTYLITRRVFEPYTSRAATIALVSAGACAVYTYFVYYSAALMTEPYFITAVLGSLYLSMRIADEGLTASPGNKRSYHGIFLALLLGATLSAAILLRQLFLLFVPFLFLWIGWRKRGRSLGTLVLTSAIIVAAILPFTVYNYTRFHRFVLLNTNAGFVIFWANHPVYGTRFEPILSPDAYRQMIPRDLLTLDEAALDQALLRLGIQFIVEEPARFGLLSLSRIPVYFEFWPSKEDGLISNIARVGGFGLFLPFMVVGLLQTWAVLLKKTRQLSSLVRSPVFLLTLFVIFYSSLHIFAWALIRYRLPVDAVLLPFAGLSLVEFVDWLSKRVQLKIPGWAGFAWKESIGEQ